jgi:hypothetical protein
VFLLKCPRAGPLSRNVAAGAGFLGAEGALLGDMVKGTFVIFLQFEQNTMISFIRFDCIYLNDRQIYLVQNWRQMKM